MEAQLSIFDDASDLSELNRHAGRGWFGAGDDLLTFLRAAERMRRLTSGAFRSGGGAAHAGVGVPRDGQGDAPDAGLCSARPVDAVRAARIVVDGRRVALPAGHTRLDPGGIGVGYGLDCARAVLRRYQIQRAFIDVSGDCLALGAPPGENGWPVTVVDSARPSRVIVSTRLRDLALATSSNAVSVVRFGDLTVGHIMDPRTDRAGPGRLARPRWSRARGSRRTRCPPRSSCPGARVRARSRSGGARALLGSMGRAAPDALHPNSSARLRDF